MRLTQLSEKESEKAKANEEFASAATEAEVAVLKELVQSMHKTMLDADMLIRRIQQVIDKD